MADKKQEVQIINLDKFETSQLPELQNKRNSLKLAIEEFPFVKITDTASYELMKKSRTGVKTIRTDLEKEKKMVVTKAKEKIITRISDEYDNLLAEEVKPTEETYQAEVTRWEDIKEQERLEKVRIEQERIDGIKRLISGIESEWNEKIETLSFENINALSQSFEKYSESYQYEMLQEFEIEFKAKLAFLRAKIEDKAKVLSEKEEIRLEQLRLENERKEAQRIQNIKDVIINFYHTWKDRIQNATLKTIANLQEEFNSLETLDCSELQADYEADCDRISKEMDDKFRVLHTAEEQRIAQENFLEEKRLFELKKQEEEQKIEAEKNKVELSKIKLKTDQRIKQLNDLDLKFDFQSTFEGFGFFIDVLDIKIYDDTKWDSLIEQIGDYKNRPEEPIAPITEEQSFEPETMVEESDFIHDVDFEEVPGETLDVQKMNFEEKKQLLIDWISKREEHELDHLIEQYLN